MNIDELLKGLKKLSDRGSFDGSNFEEIHILKKPAYEFSGVRVFGYDEKNKFFDELHFFQDFH